MLEEALERNEPVLRVREVAYSYGRTQVLQSVSLELFAGEILGLVGVNGAGKSTLMRIVLGLLKPQTGSIEWKNSSGKCRPGYVPEKLEIYPYLTGKEFLRFHAKLLGLREPQASEMVGSVLALMALESFAARRVGTYSKGQHQRLALAQAMLGDPTVLLLDEPTDGLDPLVRDDVLGALKQVRSRGVAILINSHQLHELEHISDRVAVLHQGRIVLAGKVQDLLSGSASSLQPWATTLQDVFVRTVR